MRALLSYAVALFLSTGVRAVDQLDSLEQLVHRTPAERMALLDRYYFQEISQPDQGTYLEDANEVRDLALRENDPDLLLEAAFMRAVYFFARPSEPIPQVIAVLDSVNDLAEKADVLWLRIRMENLLGQYYQHRVRDHHQAFTHFARTVDLLEKVTTQDFPLKQACYHHVGMAHYRFRDYDQAMTLVKQAIAAGPGKGIATDETNMLNTMGLCYRELGALDSSDHYFQEALTLERSAPHPREIWISIPQGNLGYNHYLRGDYAQAVPLMELDAAMARKYGDDGLAAGALTPLGDIALRQGDLVRARVLLEEAVLRARRSGQFERWKPLFPLLAKLSAMEGDVQASTVYMDSALYVRDSLDRAFSGLRMARIEQRLQHERYEAEQQELRLRMEGQVLRRNGLIAILFLCTVIALLAYNRYRLKTRAQQKLTLAEKAQAESELRLSQERLDAFMRSFQEKSALLEEATAEVARLKETVSAAEAAEAPAREVQLRLLQGAVLLTDEDWHQFSALFEQVHGGFFARLAERMPGLTPAETRYMALSRLGMNPKQMAAMLGVGAEAIRQVRLRVRRKSGLGEETSVEEIALSI